MDLLTVRETAAMLKVNPMTIRRYIRAGRLPAVRVGRQIRIERAAAEALAEPVKSPTARPREPYVFHRPSDEEIARRQALFERILANRKDRNIAPLTTADLVHLAREEEDRKWKRLLTPTSSTRRSPPNGT